MKTTWKNLHLIIYIATALLATACENEIPYHPDNREPMLVMNALLDTGSPENTVYLHLSQGYSLISPDEATLTLYVNGKEAEKPTAVSPDEEEDSANPDIFPSYTDNSCKRFRLHTTFQPGDVIRLEATAANGQYRASSEVTVPQPIESLHVDTCLAYVREGNGRVLYRQYNISLQDRSNEQNYYRLEIVNELTFRCQWDEQTTETVTHDTLISRQFNEIINREDVILTDGHIGSYDDESNDMFPTIDNKYNIFTDSRFSNSSATLKVYTPLYDNYWSVGQYYHRIYRTQTITVRLLTLTDGEYRYLRALNCLEDDDYDETLMEPITLPVNVQGGLGFVGISAARQLVFQLPETLIWEYD